MKPDIGFAKIRRRVIARAIAEEASVGLIGDEGIKLANAASSCDGKERFPDYNAASRIMMKRRRTKRHVALQVYSCRSCDGWHIGGRK